jgi:DNA-binding CsgD family transcriptional regulator
MRTRRTSGRKATLIDVVEAAYDLTDPQVDDATWAGRVHGALHPLLDRGMGSGVFLSAPERPFAAVGAQGLSPRWPEAMRQLMTSAAGPSLLRPPRPACTASQGVGPEALAENPAIVGPWKELGVADGVGIVADDGTGHMLTFFAPLQVQTTLDRRAARRYEQVAAHISAGFRLRVSARAAAAAVLTPDGHVVHAEGSARETHARTGLRTAARHIDKARGKLRREDPEAALSLWNVLVKGEWSLVDHFESDGRRYLVARENQPHLAQPRALTPPERHVLSSTALGHSLKLIAYELGLSPSTVSALRTRAMRKMGLRSLFDVARLYAPT